MLDISFSDFGPPQSLHSDRGSEFFSLEMSQFLSSWGVHQSRTTPYNPTGNAQCERFNGIIWRTVCCLLSQRQLDFTSWPSVLGEALQSVRSLHSSATGETPHDRLFTFKRKLPPIVEQGPIRVGKYAWLRRFVRSKNEPSGEVVQIAAAYPGYAVVSRLGQQKTDTINWKHLAPHPGPEPVDRPSGMSSQEPKDVHAGAAEVPTKDEGTSILPCQDAVVPELPSEHNQITSPSASPYKTRSGRTVTKPDRLMYH